MGSIKINEIYNTNNISTDIFKKHLTFRKKMDIRSIMNDLTETFIEYVVTKNSSKELFIEAVKGSINKKDLEKIKKRIQSITTDYKIDLIFTFELYEKGLLITSK